MRPLIFLLFLIPNLVQAKSSAEDRVKLEPGQTQLILLFHGLANKATSLRAMEQCLKQTFPAATVVALNGAEGMQSVLLPIDAQANACFQELKSKFNDLKSQRILLIGHSQGGLRAYAFLKKYRSELDIRGLVTLATPWEGVPGSRVDIKMVTQCLTDDVKQEFAKLSSSLGLEPQKLESQLAVEVQHNQQVCLCPGAKDVIPGSAFLQEVKATLRNEQIPILAIAGGQGDFAALIPDSKQKNSFKALNRMYTFFVSGEASYKAGRHDMYIPLFSQHAFTIVPKRHKTFTRMLVKDAFHSTAVLSICRVPAKKDLLSHPVALRGVVQFASKVLK